MKKILNFKNMIEQHDYFGINEKTMIDCLQFLYSKGHITYPRTDAMFLDESVFKNRKEDLIQLISSNKFDLDFIPSICSKINLQYRDPLFDLKPNKKTSAHNPILPVINDSIFIFPDFINSHSSDYFHIGKEEILFSIYKYVRDNYVSYFIKY